MQWAGLLKWAGEEEQVDDAHVVHWPGEREKVEV